MKVTVTPKETPEAMFNKGDVVVAKQGTRVIVVSGDADNIYTDVFPGLTVSEQGFAEYRSNWTKSLFTQFHGTITIEL